MPDARSGGLTLPDDNKFANRVLNGGVGTAPDAAKIRRCPLLFPREGLLSQFGQPFNDTVRPSLPTIAEPAWFAPPIDVRQDNGALIVVFQVPGPSKSELRVEASGRNLFVWGPRLRRRDQEEPSHRAMRVFALPFEVTPHDVHTSRSGDLLRVRIAKKMDRVSLAPRHVPPDSTLSQT